MKTYFNKLNEQSEIFTDRDIDKLIIEYEKELCCIFDSWGNIYSMWFDDL